MTRRPPTPGRRRRPGGFTLIEILVVVFILGLLTTLLVVGVNYLNTNAKRQQTRATLAQLGSLYAEWQITAKQKFLTGPLPAPGNVSTDFANSNTSDRFGPAVWFTRDLMWHLQQTPTALAALGKLPPSALMAFPATQFAPGPPPVAYANGYTPTLWKGTASYTPFESGDFGRVYLQDSVTSTTWIYYDCIQYVPTPPSGSNPPPPGNTAYWFASYPVTLKSGTSGMIPASDSPQVSVPLDAWGNPIVFVPGGQLGTMAAPLKSGAPQTATALANNGVSSPDGKAFFASAGPDGDFSLADDNLYSFEK